MADSVLPVLALASTVQASQPPLQVKQGDEEAGWGPASGSQALVFVSLPLEWVLETSPPLQL